jgi:hypothetical protein
MYLWQKIVSLFKPESVNSTPTITTAQADWMAICILGAFDLFCTRDYVGGPVIGGENNWIAAEVNTLMGKANAIKPSCSPAMQGIVSTFVGYMPNFPGYRKNWKNLLCDESAFGGNSFGAWLKSQDLSEILWSITVPTSTLTQFQLDLCFYTILFFIDLESSFIGICGNLESYWALADMPRHSGQVLQAHYFIQAGGQDHVALTSDQLASYTLSLQCLADITSVSRLSFGPYGPGYTNFASFMTNCLSAIDNPPAWSTLVPYISHAAAFTTFSKQAAAESPWNMKSGLNDMGNYLDGAATVCRQLIKLNTLIPTIFSGNSVNNYQASLNGSENRFFSSYHRCSRCSFAKQF